MVDRVLPRWEHLNLKIPEGDGEQELQQALHTWICWDKRYIRFSEGTTTDSAAALTEDMARPRSPMPLTNIHPPSQPLKRPPAWIRRHQPLKGAPAWIRHHQPITGTLA